jgi:hypothetical protein
MVTQAGRPGSSSAEKPPHSAGFTKLFVPVIIFSNFLFYLFFMGANKALIGPAMACPTL